METSKRWHLAIEVSLIEFFCAAGVGCFIAHANDAELPGYVAVAGVPACAAGIFVAICCFFAHVIEKPVVRFPLNLTLPLIFCSLLPVCSILIATPEEGLLAMQDHLRFAQIWVHPVNLFTVYLGQVIALSLFAAWSRKGV